MKFSSIVISLVSFASMAFASDVIVATEKDFQDIVVNSGKYSLVEFYASWCGHCKSLAPIYEEVATAFAKQSNKVQIVKIDADENKKIGNKYGIKGFPTLKLFSPNSDSPEDYEGGRDFDSLVSYVSQKTGARAKVQPKPASAIIKVNDDNFDDIVVGSDKPAIVAFTASWCGHCKRLKPEYEKLATVYKNDDDIIVAEVSTTDGPADYLTSRYNVGSFPTILYFPKGDKKNPIAYESGREVGDLVEYINLHAGLNRKADGSLDSHAGVIASLDNDIKKLINASEDEQTSLAAELLSRLNIIEAKTASYYKKLINKILDKQEFFISKEYKRLSFLLGKGNLVPSKADNFQQRINILNVFREAYE